MEDLPITDLLVIVRSAHSNDLPVIVQWHSTVPLNLVKPSVEASLDGKFHIIIEVPREHLDVLEEEEEEIR